MTSLEEASRRLNEAFARLESTLSAQATERQEATRALEAARRDNERLAALSGKVASELDGAIARIKAVLGE